MRFIDFWVVFAPALGFFLGYNWGIHHGTEQGQREGYQQGWRDALSRPRVVLEAAKKVLERKRKA